MIEYYVVLFEKYASVVPETWVNIEDRTFQWPPFHFDKPKMKYMKPDDAYITYNYKKILGPYDFNTANIVEKESVDISTNDDTDTALEKIKNSQQSVKRTIKRNSRYISDSESDEKGNHSDEGLRSSSDVEDSPNLRKLSYSEKPVLPTPPKIDTGKPTIKQIKKEHIKDIKIPVVKIKNNELLTKPYHFVSQNETGEKNNTDKVMCKENIAARQSNSKDEWNVPTSTKSYKKQNSLQSQNSSSIQKSASLRLTDKGKRTLGLQIKNSVKNVPIDIEDNYMEAAPSVSMNLIPSRPINNTKNTPTANIHKKNRDVSIDEYNRLKKKLSIMEKQLKSKQLVDTDTEDEDDDLASLPLKTENELLQFDEIIKNDTTIRRKLIQMLKKIDGPNLTAFTHRCMERLMSSELAVKYSWSGQTRGKNKEYKTLKFKNTKLADVIIKAIAKTRRTYTEYECRKIIQKWLNTAKQRLEYQIQKANQEMEEENIRMEENLGMETEERENEEENELIDEVEKEIEMTNENDENNEN